MFYKESDINEVLKCPRCQMKYIDPRCLPCMECICNSCLESLLEKQSTHLKDKFKCCYCNEEHEIPEKGFPIPKHLEKLLAKKPNVIYRSKSLEELNVQLQSMKIEIDDIECTLENGIEKIKERCSLLKHLIQIKTESLIDEISKLSNEMVKKIDKYEIECAESFEKSIEIKERVKKIASEGKSFYETTNKYLAQFKINEQEVTQLISKTKQTLNDCKILSSDLLQSLFTTSYLEFDENIKKLDTSIIGCLSSKNLKQIIDTFDSKILDRKQKQDLLKLCRFDASSKWNLIYQASRDGRTAQAFHSKCHKKKKTLTIIKSTEGYIFGGYTDQAWNSGGQYRSDKNAFIFSLVNPYSKPLFCKINNAGSNAICCHSNHGPTFGGGHDIFIRFDDGKSYTNLGVSYSINLEGSKSSNNKNELLTGNRYFDFSDLEVFQFSLK
jgi:hypothetical protein